MKVILTADVERLGTVGDVVSVAPGFARNYLLPRGMAIPGTEQNVARIDQEKRRHAKAVARELQDASALAERLGSVSLTLTHQAGEGDRIFGSVTSMEIAAALEKEGFTVDRRQIEIEEPIRALGVYTVPVRLHRDVTASLKVWVVKE